MHTLSTTVGLLALAPALLATLFLAKAMDFFTMRAPQGHAAVGLVALFVFPILGWLATLVSAMAAVRRGSLDWVSSTPGVPTLLVALTIVGLAVLSMFAAGVSMEVRIQARTAYGMAGGLLLPLLTQAFLLSLLVGDVASLRALRWPRVSGWVLAGLAAVTLAGCLVMWVRSEMEQAEREAASRQEREEEDKAGVVRDAQRTVDDNAQLDALPDNTPLAEFLTHLFIDRTEAHNAYAARRIRKLPNLTERLAERLADPAPIQREYAANFIRVSETPPDPAWAPAVRKAIGLLAEDYRLDAADPSRNMITHPLGLTKGMLLTAQRFEGVRFDAEVRTLRAALQAYTASSDRDEAVRLVDVYLAGKVVER
jgi:hypothetical protein